MPQTADLSIESFAPLHIDGAAALSSEAGWLHRPEDWALTLSVSTGFVALAGGRVVGTALCSNFGPVATLNMIIVARAFRGRGLGRRLMSHVIAAAGDREKRLVATVEGLPLYESLGFLPAGDILQHQGMARETMTRGTVELAGVPDIATLSAMDLVASGMHRPDLLARIAGKGEVLLAEGGFAMIRRFGRGHVVGPVVAAGPVTARDLIAAAVNRHAGGFLRIDMPETTAQPEFCERLGLQAVGGGLAMLRDERSRPAAEIDTYALVSQALG